MWFILWLVTAGAAFAAVYILRKRGFEGVEVSRIARWARVVGAMAAALAILSCLTVVPAGHVGVVDFFGRYVGLSGNAITRAIGQERMFAKLARPHFLTDMKPLLPAAQAELLSDESTLLSFSRVFETFIDRLPGDP